MLLVDVFMLYRESNHKYVNSYQNSIRDPLTRLYNRSFFYDTLNQQLAKVNPQHPLSVISVTSIISNASMITMATSPATR